MFLLQYLFIPTLLQIHFWVLNFHKITFDESHCMRIKEYENLFFLNRRDILKTEQCLARDVIKVSIYRYCIQSIWQTGAQRHLWALYLCDYSYLVIIIWIIIKPLKGWVLTNVFERTYSQCSFYSTCIYLPWYQQGQNV